MTPPPDRRSRPGERLRVMQVVLSLAPGGTERLVVEVVKRLAGEIACSVCCLDDRGAWAAEAEAAGAPVVALGRAPGFHPGLGARLARAAGAQGAHVLHCHQYTPFVFGRIAATLRPGLRLVFTEHGRLSDAPPSRKRRLVNPLLGRMPGQEMFSVSEDLKRHMVAEGLPADRIEVVYNGIPVRQVPDAAARTAARRALALGPQDFAVGTVARLDPVKDIPNLVAGFVDLLRAVPRARLIVVGDGPERGVIEARRHDLGLDDAVVMLGHREDVTDLLPGLDAFANTSISEGVSLTILEAMAAALPVVATAVGGTPEVIVDGETGVLVPPRSPEDVARALARLASEADLAAAMGRAGRARMERMFTLDRMVADYRAAYERVAGTSASGVA